MIDKEHAELAALLNQYKKACDDYHTRALASARMESEPFVRGMLSQALKLYTKTSWYQFIYRAELRGWIKACKATLGELND